MKALQGKLWEKYERIKSNTGKKTMTTTKFDSGRGG